MSADHSFDSDYGPIPDQEDVFEEFGVVDMDAFIDAQFENVFKEDEQMYGPEKRDTVLKEQLDAARSYVFADGCSIEKDSIMFSIDRKLPAPSEQLFCSECRNALTEDKISDPRKLVVTEEQLCDISDDVGTCWRQLGPKLKIKASKIHNLDEEYRSNRDKANALLIIWKQQEGSDARLGYLADSLESIGRKSIADKLLGVSDVKLPTCVKAAEELTINLTLKCDLDADLENKLMLCEDGHGKKYILKEISSDGGQWNVEEVQKNKRFLESVAVAARDLERTAEQRRQESLKRISSEVQELRQKLKRVKLDCRVTDSTDVKEEEQSTEMLADEKVLHDELEGLLKSCETQRQSWQAMYAALIKLVGEAGQPREDNCKCLTQLFDFTKELHDQATKFFPRIEQIQEQKQQLDESQCVRLEDLKKWQRAHTQQLDGLERLLSSLLDQGKIRAKKLMNRRSEPIISKKTPSGGFGRRRTKTDSSSKSSSKSYSVSEPHDLNKKDKISEPLCARRMCLMDTSKLGNE